MELTKIRLRLLSLPLRIAVTCLLALIAGGYLAGALHMVHHYEKKDEEPGLSMDDIMGSFHGVYKTSPLLTSIQGNMRKYLPEEKEYGVLLKWLESDRISEDYDSLQLGDDAPAEILDRRCLRCHDRNAKEGDGIGQRIPLEYWDDVKKVAFSKRLDPVPSDILIQSTHTHALAMPLFTIVIAILFLATSWPRRIRHTLVMLTFLALVADLASWWLTRSAAPFAYLLLASGAVFGALLGLQMLGVFIELWLGPKEKQAEP